MHDDVTLKCEMFSAGETAATSCTWGGCRGGGGGEEHGSVLGSGMSQ